MCIHFNNTNCFMNILDKVYKNNNKTIVCVRLFLVFIFSKRACICINGIFSGKKRPALFHNVDAAFDILYQQKTKNSDS